MKNFEKKIENRTYKVEEFESVLEMSNVNQQRVVTEAWSADPVSKRNIEKKSSWYGVSSYEEAYELLAGGWEAGTKKVASLVDKIATQGTKGKVEFFNNVQGFMPNVPLALLNVPQSMIDTKRIQIKSKVITLVYDNTANCGISSEKMIEAGKNIVEAVINLEMSGYRVNVKVITSACEYKGNRKKRCDMSLVNIKNANQSLNLKKMMFPLAHSSWLRVIGFDWQDKSPVTADHYLDGRGTAFCDAVNRGDFKESDISEVLGSNVIFVTYYDAISGAESIEKKLTSKKVA